MNNKHNLDRRRFLTTTGAGVLALGSGIQLVLPTRASGADKAKVVVKYDWLISNGQMGDVVALHKGYFEDAGLDVEFSPGGPNSATVPPVISGAASLGQFSDAAQLFSARAGGVPIKIIAAGFRTGPYAFTSKPEKPLRSVEDLKGLTIGIQPTARFVIEAIAAKAGIEMSELKTVNVGFDKAPLVRGEVDAIGGWITNTQALSVVGEDRIDLLASDLGLPAYSNVYFATDAAIENNADTLAAFIGAAGKGWGFVHSNPQEAVNILVDNNDGISEEWELKTVDLILKLSFDDKTAEKGWGTFDPASLDEQLALYDSIGQYTNGRPSLEDVHTTKILEMTSDARPKLDYSGK